jgi:hypothetical protein
MSWLWVAAGIARVVVGPGSQPPDIEPDDAVLFVHRANTCLPDGGIPDAETDGGLPDGGLLDAASDGGGPSTDAPITPFDAGVPPPETYVPHDAPIDGGTPDDGGLPDAGTSECGDSVMMIVQPKFTLSTSGSTFALLYVTPSAPVMRLESPTTFDDLAVATAPDVETQIVEIPDPALGTRCAGCVEGGGDYSGGGCGASGGDFWSPPSGGGGGVGGSTIATIGPYEVATKEPGSRTDLATWLDELGYVYQTSDLDALEPYIMQGWSVVAVRIAQTTSFTGGLQPISMTWAGTEMTVPLRLASQSSLTVYFAADHRYELPGAHVSFAGYTGSSYVTRNEVTDLSSDLTAYRADADDWHRDVQVIYQDEHVPVTKDCDDQGCCQSGPGTTNGLIWGSALLLVMRRRPRRHGRL